MDAALLAVLAMAAIAILVSVTLHSRGRRDAGRDYQRVFNAGAGGLLLFVSGVIGWDLSYSRGWFQGTKWADGPIWWQVVIGAALLLLAGVWARRARPRPSQR